MSETGAVHRCRDGDGPHELGQHVHQLLHARRGARAGAGSHAAVAADAIVVRRLHGPAVDDLRQAGHERSARYRGHAVHVGRPARACSRSLTGVARIGRRLLRSTRRRASAAGLDAPLRARGHRRAEGGAGPTDAGRRLVRLQPADGQGLGPDAVRVARLPRRRRAGRRSDAVAGKPITSAESLRDALRSKRVGDEVEHRVPSSRRAGSDVARDTGRGPAGRTRARRARGRHAHAAQTGVPRSAGCRAGWVGGRGTPDDSTVGAAGLWPERAAPLGPRHWSRYRFGREESSSVVGYQFGGFTEN